MSTAESHPLDTPVRDRALVKIKKVRENARIPHVVQSGDVAADIYAPIDASLPARSRIRIPTGIAIQLPPGYRGRIYSRSGLSANFGIEVGAGIIDNHFRDEIQVVLYNHSNQPYEIKAGDRIAQLAVERYTFPEFVEVDHLEPTSRTSGFGSSGR